MPFSQPELKAKADALEAARASIRNIDSQISELSFSLVALEDARTYAIQQLELDAVELTPILRLPVELVRKIMLDYITFEPPVARSSNARKLLENVSAYDFGGLTKLRIEDILLLSSICRKWRTVAYETSALYNHIPIHPVRHKSSGLRGIWCPRWVERSGVTPLRVQITTAPPKINGPPVYYLDVKGAIVSKSQHWAHFQSAVGVFDWDWFKGTKKPLQALESIEFWSNAGMGEESGDFGASHWNDTGDLFAEAPLLRRVSFTGASRWERIPLPWEGVEYSELSAGLASVVSILRRATSLQTLVLEPKTFGDTDDITLDPASLIVLPMLDSMAFRTHDHEASRKLWSVLDAPRMSSLLLELQTHISPDELEWPPASLITFLSRSSATLTDFTFQTEAPLYEPLELIALLRQMPNLISLSIIEHSLEIVRWNLVTPSGSNLWKTIKESSQEGGTEFVPQLTKLYVSGLCKGLDGGKLFIEAMEAREHSRTAKPLEHVRINIRRRHLDDENWPARVKAIRSGLFPVVITVAKEVKMEVN